MPPKQHFDIPLHDIKPIVEVQEYSFYYFLGAVGIAIILACGVVYLLYFWYKKRAAFNVRKYHAKLLHTLDLKDTKNSAYAISSYGFTFKDDSPRHVEMFKNLNERLQSYKYKKSVEVFDSETIAYIELYKGMIDV
ncbi:MAG: hypothetical protein J7J96_02360 [Sulfurimonas sp.]|nr:hypothetical protein [Sulfurimonas sp.]